MDRRDRVVVVKDYIDKECFEYQFTGRIGTEHNIDCYDLRDKEETKKELINYLIDDGVEKVIFQEIKNGEPTDIFEEFFKKIS